MALNVPVAGGAVLATDISQTVNLVQVPSGGQEIRQYFLAGQVTIASGVISNSIPTLNHFTLPLSASINTSGGDVPQAPAGGLGTVHIGSLTRDSVQIYADGNTNSSTNARAGGQFFVNY